MNHLMKNNNNVILIFLATIFTTGLLAMEPVISIKSCAKIHSDLKRLACFDRVVKGINTDTILTEKIPQKQQKDKIAAERKTIKQTTISTFGLEKKIASAEQQEIRSRINGEFTGWSGKTIFKLNNGQVWQQSAAGRVYHKATDPVVTIRKGIFGSFRLKIEGLNTRISVKRIK